MAQTLVPTGTVSVGGQPTVVGHEVLNYTKSFLEGERKEVFGANGQFIGWIMFCYKIEHKLTLMVNSGVTTIDTLFPINAKSTSGAFTTAIVDSVVKPYDKNENVFEVTMHEYVNP